MERETKKKRKRSNELGLNRQSPVFSFFFFILLVDIYTQAVRELKKKKVLTPSSFLFVWLVGWFTLKASEKEKKRENVHKEDSEKLDIVKDNTNKNSNKKKKTENCLCVCFS